jgi:hypothetical protein
VSALGAAALAETRAALAAGATPSAALLAGFSGPGPLEPVTRAVRLGAPLRDVAADLSTGDPATDLLVRALAVAEETGAGAVTAVDQALAAAQDEAATTRLLRARSAQARGTARLLAALPIAGWLGVALLGGELAFLQSPLGMASTGLAVVLAASGAWWSARLLRRASAAADAADPLAGPVRPDWRRGAAVGGPVLASAWILAGSGVGLLTGAAAGVLAARWTRPREHPGGAAETAELVAVALGAGLSPAAALAVVAPLAPPGARRPLAAAAGRVAGGWTPGEALAGTGLQPLGEVLEATQRWGAPAAQALAALAADLRAQRRAAADQAAERTQLLLVFPTTLLTLPAFVLAVVPPLLWGAFAG